MGTVVLDTSVVLGLLDRQDAHHHTAVRLITEHTTAGTVFGLPASVLAEVLVSEARRGHPAVARRRAHLVSMFGPVRLIDEKIAVEAAQALKIEDPLLKKQYDQRMARTTGDVPADRQQISKDLARERPSTQPATQPSSPLIGSGVARPPATKPGI